MCITWVNIYPWRINITVPVLVICIDKKLTEIIASTN